METKNGNKPIKQEHTEHIEHTSSPVTSTGWMQFVHFVREKKFIVIFVVLFAIIIGLVVYEQTSALKPSLKTVTIKKQVLMRRSKELGFIYRGLTGKAVDVNTGKIVVAARIFSLNDSTVYLELDLQHPPVGTLVDYIRYKEGRYVDHGEIAIPTANTKNLLFKWSINKLLANVTNGHWSIATYTNGILEKRILYTVANNKISSVDSSGKILATDSDYTLTSVLADVAQQ